MESTGHTERRERKGERCRIIWLVRDSVDVLRRNGEIEMERKEGKAKKIDDTSPDATSTVDYTRWG